ncbi:TPA: TIGR02646 family protein [Vibrio parahaemolyticus]|uniref:retron Ec78 anti-phage system effector HNH endonuclease PtuB n=1 Tax=Vibrio harveyi group TaxID=717610 RepID=UPI001123FFAC|nr:MULTISPECIES: retron Ec78 anti-phage system effector HNH endonuclease PtuB [Vibrio harveyi group]EGR1562717.1 TIGR02646 family protein [Vibrio alginolyticus]ELB1991378.1 TIGR02646 family protein [Vibrio parahaemolyticus]MCZ6312992.1 TIGR02646 family protein [Vibrio parahaemolyticus]TOG47340.1 TIGR02646 family protein [Vibrio parahaemolyticus]WEK79229.1 TIGR02646 family protein [Vibrio alginolyticus]
MRKINKSQAPNELTIYAISNPDDTWDNFRGNNSSDAKKVKKKIFSEQNYICAYCEIDLCEDNVLEHHRRVEHFNSKSGWVVGDTQPNWHLDWNNVIGVCIGGTDRNNAEQFVMPDNKSCDSYKEHLETNHGESKKWLGKIVSPLEDNLSSDMFNYSLATGELEVNIEAANSKTFEHNDFATSSELLESTIEKLNLNCDRLNLARREVHISFERLIAHFRKSKDMDRFKFMLKKWIGAERPLYFQTTRDILVRTSHIAQKALKE